MFGKEEVKMLKFMDAKEADENARVAIVRDTKTGEEKVFDNFILFGYKEHEMECIAKVGALQLLEAVEKMHQVLDDVLEKMSPAARAVILARVMMQKVAELAEEEDRDSRGR